MPFENNVEN